MDPDEIIEKFRHERYRNNASGSRARLDDSLVIRRLYYHCLRPVLPISMRRRLQKARLRDWKKLLFPHWPVDRTVERILERLLALSMKAQGIRTVPFVWFWPESATSCVIMTHDVEHPSRPELLLATQCMSWIAPPDGSIELMERTVHLWRCRVTEAASDEHKLVSLLSPDEHERAARFRIEHARKQFVVGRGVLRDVLSRYFQWPPQDLRFAYTSLGKPYLEEENHHRPIVFNLAHSGNICLVAVACRDRLGVDVEWMRPGIDCEGVARDTFSPDELAALQAVDPQLRGQLFFETWTRKEAYLKAIGQGLSDLGKATPDPSRWTVLNLSPDPGYIAAMAIEVCNVHVDAWHWSS